VEVRNGFDKLGVRYGDAQIGVAGREPNIDSRGFAWG